MRRILLASAFLMLWVLPSPTHAQAVCVSALFPRPCAIFESYETYLVDSGGDFIDVNFMAHGEWTRWDPSWRYFEMHFDIFFEHDFVSTGYGGFGREIHLWNNVAFERGDLEPYGELLHRGLTESLTEVYIFGSGETLISDGFTVVPEPSAWLLLGTGLVGLAGVSLRMRRGRSA